MCSYFHGKTKELRTKKDQWLQKKKQQQQSIIFILGTERFEL
jgi:hypothetical protein